MTKNQKSTFYKNKTINTIENIDVNNILVSKKKPYGNKNSVKYYHNDIIRPLCIRLPKMTGYARKFDENVTLSFIVKISHTKIWEIIEKLMKINFESNPVYGDNVKYVKTKIKTYAGSIITNFHNKKMSKEKAPCKCLLIIMMIDSVIKTNKNYYSQTLLEECKYTQEKIKIENYIGNDLEDNDSDSDSNNETESDINNEE